jgi:ATP-dependent Zn protease
VRRAARIARIAYHEAGHAIVALALNGIVTLVRIQDGEGGGTVRYQLPEPVSDAHRIIIAMAGGVAEQLRYRSSGFLPSPNARADQCIWLELTSHLPQEAQDAYLRMLQAQVRALLRINWHAVEAVAMTLVEHRNISGAQVRKLVGVVQKWSIGEI